ncbi:hypothetical protein [Rhizobium sp. LjRoot254]|uniref:hypothetical protein n=1 Tax=Rhizobium sp. LjRoot254 TaxID=3342297 RepID=UPI003ED1169C
MPSHIFRFYSLEPRTIFLMVGERWPSAIVRRNAWKIGGSVVWYTTLVLDDEAAAHQFEQWLGQHARREDIRKLVGAEKDYDGAYGDAIFHRGGLKSRTKLTLSVPWRRVRRIWLGLRKYVFGFWLRLKS